MTRAVRVVPMLCLGLAVVGTATVNAQGTSRFGVIAGGAAANPSPIIEALRVLHAGAVRVNGHLGGRGATTAGARVVDLAPYITAGLTVVVTLNNADPSNVDTTYGTLREFPVAGFPFRSRARYQERIRETIAPAMAVRGATRQLWVQCENEVSDAAANPRARYWRGTLDQYLDQLAACFEAVRAVDPSIPVVVAGFASRALDAVIDSGNPLHADATRYVDRLLAADRYDAVDLHFYGCVGDIATKIAAVRNRLRPGTRWISTENGGPDSRCRATPTAWSANPSRFEEVQARQVPERLGACAEGGGSVCLWFSLADMPGEESVFAHLGLLELPAAARRAARTGTPSTGGAGISGVRRKPAWDAFREFAAAHR